jgi:pyruvate/2-oxoglutarate dehydrogenase complex dihydrolipoamide acyltransferase (E2) component
MNDFEIKFPDLGLEEIKGNLSKWLVKDGELVELNQDIVEVEKGVLTIKSMAKGILKHLASKGDIIYINNTIGIINNQVF